MTCRIVHKLRRRSGSRASSVRCIVCWVERPDTLAFGSEIAESRTREIKHITAGSKIDYMVKTRCRGVVNKVVAACTTGQRVAPAPPNQRINSSAACNGVCQRASGNDKAFTLIGKTNENTR